MPKQTWSAVKSVAIKLNRDELIGLTAELYRLSKQNQTFLHARFADAEAVLEESKVVVGDCLYPDMQSDRPLQVAKAKKVVADFCKAVANPIAQADLMLVFLEQGNAFTVEYGDVDAGFYNALITMARRAAETICACPMNCSRPSEIGSLRSCKLHPASAGAITTSLLRSTQPLFLSEIDSPSAVAITPRNLLSGCSPLPPPAPSRPLQSQPSAPA